MELKYILVLHNVKGVICYTYLKLQKLAWISHLKMCANFSSTFNKLTQSNDYIQKHSTHKSAFSRNRLFNFKTLISFLLGFNTTSITRELRKFFEISFGEDFPLISKSAFSQARHKLKHSCFVDLNKKFCDIFYSQKNISKTWRGFRLLSIDGSTLQLPNSPTVKKHFGMWNPRNGNSVPMARVSMCYDVLNDLTLDALLSPKSSGERALGYEHVKTCVGPKDTLLLDRGYAGFWVFAGIIQKEAHFVCRVEASKWNVAQELLRSTKMEKEFEIVPSYPSKNTMLDLGIDCESIKIRAVKITLPTGEKEVLFTTLPKSVSRSSLSDLYQLRWPIEEQYKVYKCRIEIGKFTGKSKAAVLQDFHAKVLAVNLNSIIRQAANQIADKKYQKRKGRYKVNVTESISIMKHQFYKLLCGENQKQILDYIVNKVVMYVDIIRPKRSVPRNKSNKNPVWKPTYCAIS